MENLTQKQGLKSRTGSLWQTFCLTPKDAAYKQLLELRCCHSAFIQAATCPLLQDTDPHGFGTTFRQAAPKSFPSKSEMCWLCFKT